MQIALVCKDQDIVCVLTLADIAVFTVNRLLISLIGGIIKKLTIAKLILNIVAGNLLYGILVVHGFLSVFDQSLTRLCILFPNEHQVF
jgi:hypothetical protein